MCAECHSTNLEKNYDPKTDTYQTTWSEIDVSCEACHGPGSRHVEWAEIPEMARSQTQNNALEVNTSGLSSHKQVELCAPCHSLRAPVGDYTHRERDLLDSHAPSLLTEDMYFADGQILEEVYVYGSFIQSKMYHHGVRCNDCHDVHSAKLVQEGNALCLQCHRASEYDSEQHHFHKKTGEKGDPVRAADGEVLFDVGTGAECVGCHMPGRYYMGIDYRPDHSFRIPRPGLSVKLGTPNACNRCHTDKTAQWSDETITKWYGPSRRNHYGTLIEAGRKGQPEVHKDLIQLTRDPLYPVIVRATALSLLAGYPGEDSLQAMELALMDDEPLIRRTAVQSIRPGNEKRLAQLLAPLLYDPVKAVRIEAASRLAGAPSKNLSSDQKKVYRIALNEFETTMEYAADFAFGRYNLGNLNVALDRPEEAIRHYQAAIKIDGLFYPAKVNLAMLHNRRGKRDEAEVLFREVIADYPEMYEIAYSLGLLLAEMKKYDQALVYLEKAAKGMSERADTHYNLGLLLQYLKREAAAEAALIKALELRPDSMEYLYSLANHYLKHRQPQKAKVMAERMVARYPDHPMGQKLLEVIERDGLKETR